MSYYDNQESVANIYVGLVERGWNCFGYKADESDSMTDYWSPARWEGIAEKNGFVLLIDVYSTSQSGSKITKKGYTPDWSKIEKLQATINDKAASENEKLSSQKIINNMMIKETESTIVVAEYPTFKNANPKGCNWHIEKDGNIIAKGKGAFQCDGYLFSTYKDETMEKVNAFIDKIESKIKGTEQLEAVQQKVVKTVTKPIEVTDRNYIQEGDILTFEYHGHYWIVNSVNEKTFHYEILGSEKRGYQRTKNGKRYYDYMTKFEKNLENGKIKIYELKEVEEVTYKTVYKKVNRKGQEENLLSGEVVETVQTEAPKKAAKTVKENKQTTIIKDESIQVELKLNDKLNGIELYFTGKPSEGTRELLKENGFRWSKYNKCWYAKQSDKTILFAESLVSAYNDTITEEPETVEEVTETHKTAKEEQTEVNNDITETTPVNEQILVNDSDLVGRKIFGQWGVMAGWNNGTITGETIYNEVVIKWEDGHEEYFNIKDLIFVHENTSLDPVGVYLMPLETPTNDITEQTDNNSTIENDLYNNEVVETPKGYYCHFKAWYNEPESITEQLENYNIPFYEVGEKFIFEGINLHQLEIVQMINKENGSILFDDSYSYNEIKQKETIQPEEPKKMGKVLDFNSKFKQRQEKQEVNKMTDHFIENILPYLNTDELTELQAAYTSKDEKEVDNIWQKLILVTAVRRAKDEILKQN
jgi:hypothetical protein